jgi:hypothetical protein
MMIYQGGFVGGWSGLTHDVKLDTSQGRAAGNHADIMFTGGICADIMLTSRQALATARQAVIAITETDRIRLVLFDMHNRTLGFYLAAI